VTRASFAGDWLPMGAQWHALAPAAGSGAAAAGAHVVVMTDTIEWVVRAGPERQALSIVRRRQRPQLAEFAQLEREAADAARAARAAAGATRGRPASAGRASGKADMSFEL
jgi:hypothetical protein